MASEKLGWRHTFKQEGGTIIWVDSKDDVATRLRTMGDAAWLSHVPGVGNCCNKDTLARALEQAGADFWPRSWCIPEVSVEEIAEYAFPAAQRPRATLILKPAAGTQGKGIEIVRSARALQLAVDHLDYKGAIVQEYVERPLLLDGRKWDVRIYALAVPASDADSDFAVFLACEGLVRVCVDSYEPPCPRNLHRTLAHLTNYSISKYSDKYEHNEDPSDGSKGCKRTLTAVLRHMGRALKIKTNGLWTSLGELARGTIDAMATPMKAAAFDPGHWDSEELARLVRQKYGKCFHILGLDVLLDEDLNPWLLEVNCNPSLSLEEVRPLQGVSSRSEANQLFVEAKRERAEEKAAPGRGHRWGRPCRCAKLPRPHVHHQCPVDTAVKLPVVEGAMTIIQRLSEADETSVLSATDLAEGTIYVPV